MRPRSYMISFGSHLDGPKPQVAGWLKQKYYPPQVTRGGPKTLGPQPPRGGGGARNPGTSNHKYIYIYIYIFRLPVGDSAPNMGSAHWQLSTLLAAKMFLRATHPPGARAHINNQIHKQHSMHFQLNEKACDNIPLTE